MGYKKTTKYKGITRVDRNAGYHDDGRRIKATHGYFVRVTWKGQTYRKFFSDTVHGDRLGALEAAKDWRIAKEREVGKPRSERQVMGIPHSETGIVGIRKIVSGPWGHQAYEANWVNPDGSIGRTSYSIEKNGDREALKMAIEARKRGEEARRNSRFSGRPQRKPRDTQPQAAAVAATPAPARGDDWFDSVDAARFEPPSFSLPSFGAPLPPRLEDYDGT